MSSSSVAPSSRTAVAAACAGGLLVRTLASGAAGSGSSTFASTSPVSKLSTSAGVGLLSKSLAVPAPLQGGVAKHPTGAAFGTSLLGLSVAAAAAVAVVLPRSRKAAGRRVTVVHRMAEPVLRLGTRGSPLALAQAYEAKRVLGEKFPELSGDDAVAIQIISTTGDQRLEISLAEIGGKGLFTRELDVALMSKEVDFCVHSTKDVPTELIPNTELCCMLPREDTRDVLISADGNITRVEDFPDGALIGTASLRRQAQIYAKNPNVKCVNFRGNVQTRLRKLKAGDVSGTLLAYAGLKRMNMEEHATRILDWDEMLPAISQGAISFQCRSDDERVLNYLRPLSDADTMATVTCERAFLAALDGNCKTPIAGQARVVDGQIDFQGLVSSPDGDRVFRTTRKGPISEASKIGHEAGMEVRKEAGEKFFEEMQSYVQEVQAANEKPVRA